MPTTVDPWNEEGRRFENVSEKPESRHEKGKTHKGGRRRGWLPRPNTRVGAWETTRTKR